MQIWTEQTLWWSGGREIARQIVLCLTYSQTGQTPEDGLQSLKMRRQGRYLSFNLICMKHPLNSRLFPKNPDKNHNIRDQETFVVNHANHNFYRDLAVPYCQRLLNKHVRDQKESEAGKKGPRLPQDLEMASKAGIFYSLQYGSNLSA